MAKFVIEKTFKKKTLYHGGNVERTDLTHKYYAGKRNGLLLWLVDKNEAIQYDLKEEANTVLIYSIRPLPAQKHMYKIVQIDS